MWTQSCFKSGFWNAFWNTQKRAFWIVIPLESLILGHVNAKKIALKPCISAWVNQCTRTAQYRNKILPPSAQILIVIGKSFAMHVNARSSNQDPNHILDRDPKCLLERDSSPCEHSQYHLCLPLKMCLWVVEMWGIFTAFLHKKFYSCF